MTLHVDDGPAPLVIGFPHVGVLIPDAIRARLTPAALALADTDFALPELYDFAGALGASRITAHLSRLVVDLNRPPDDAPLYPGQAGTGLVPTQTFDGAPVYADGQAPCAAEQAARRAQYWEPYHAALADLLAAKRRAHGRVLLWDAHSIADRVPRLFDGVLPTLNIGTADGTSCAPEIACAAAQAAKFSPFSSVTNGRFKGGYVTRRYGDPARGVHAIQLELAKQAYLADPGAPALDTARLPAIRAALRAMMEAALAAIPDAF